MKTIILILLSATLIGSLLYGQGFRQVGVAPPYGDNFGGIELLGPEEKDASDAGRGLLAGTDIDNDGKIEVFVTSYADHKVYGFEQTSTDTFALVWQSADNTTTDSHPRDIKTGDLDNDGNPEIIFFLGQTLGPDNPEAGLQVYEWDGTDDGYGAEPTFRADFYSVLNDSLSQLSVENFSVGDIDQDGKQELLIANNGNNAGILGTKDGSTTYSEDRFMILSVTGNFGEFGTTLVEEFAVSPRDHDKDGEIDSPFILGGGTPTDIIICDTDGDGLLEAACSSYNYLAIFFVEATGPDAYTLGATTVVGPAYPDDTFTLGLSAADMDGNGKDEVYLAGWFPEIGERPLYMIKDMDGDATNIDADTELSTVGTGAAYGCTAVPDFGVVVGGEPGKSDITLFELEGGEWTKSVHVLSDATSGWAFKISDAFDSDNDGNWEFGIPYQAVLDSVDTNNDGILDAVDPNENRVFRIVEWDENYVSVKNTTLILPSDYKLAQNYPNPFNPTTTITYTLPIENNITVNIYNFLGEHVTTLVNNELQPAGTHDIIWNALDKKGARVPTGTYFYELKYGNFSQTKRMTLLK